MFTFYLFVAIVVYSTNPGGVPPFQRVEINQVEFDLAACHERMGQVISRPLPLVKVYADGPRATWAHATILGGWRCVPFAVAE